MSQNEIVYNGQNGDTIAMPMSITTCLICGKKTPVSMWQCGPAVCDECKQAVAWVKEKMKEKEE